MARGLTNNKAWYDKAFVSVSPVSGTEVEMRSFTSSFSVSGGYYDTEGLEVFGGKLNKIGTKEDIELSFDGYAASTEDFDWIFHGVTDSSVSITSSTQRKHRVTVLWSDATGLTSATEAINTGSEGYRQIYAEAYCLGVEYNMDAGEELNATLRFKLPFEDETGGMNFKKETSLTGSSTSAVPAYTTTTKF